MTRFLTILLVFGLVLSTSGLMAQDIHYSQFYNSPITLNPALTGKINGKFRIGALYRNQWFGRTGGPAGATYSTPSIYFDMPIRLKSGDAVGIGADIMNDQSKGGAFSRIQIALSAAYHKALGAKKNHSLSIGVQLFYKNQRLDMSKIKFGNQVGDNLLLTDQISSGENLNQSTNNIDFNTGLMWNAKISEKLHLYAGISGFNMVQPYKKFNNVEGVNTPDKMRRMTVAGGADIRLSKVFSLLPSLIYMREASAQETNFGLMGAFDASADFILYVGAYYRVKDAFIPYIGADYKGWRLGLSYDAAATTQWNGINPGKVNGSFELSLTYVGRYIPLPGIKPVLYCPRF